MQFLPSKVMVHAIYRVFVPFTDFIILLQLMFISLTCKSFNIASHEHERDPQHFISTRVF